MNTEYSIDGRVDTDTHLRGIDTMEVDDELISEMEQNRGGKSTV